MEYFDSKEKLQPFCEAHKIPLDKTNVRSKIKEKLEVNTIGFLYSINASLISTYQKDGMIKINNSFTATNEVINYLVNNGVLSDVIEKRNEIELFVKLSDGNISDVVAVNISHSIFGYDRL